MADKQDLLCALSAAAYAQENGYRIRPADGYVETNNMLLRRFEVEKEEDE